MADSGIDDDRLAPVQPPLLHLSAGGTVSPHDPIGHGTAVASILVANRSDVGVVGLVPDATLLSARIVRSEAVQRDTKPSSTPSWTHSAGCAGMARRSSTCLRRPSQPLRSWNRCGHCSSRVLWSLPQSATPVSEPSPRFPASQPGVLGVGELAAGSSTQVAKESTRGTVVDLVAPAQGIRVVASGAERVSKSTETALTPPGTSFATPIVTAAAAMVWASHRDWTAAEVASALTSTATPLTRLVPNINSGYGVLNVSKALHAQKLPDSHEPNDWVAAALAQRPLRPGSVVVASLGWAGDTRDVYTVDVPAGTTATAVLRRGGNGLTLRRLPIGATDAVLTGVPRKRPTGGQITLPAGRSLLVVARGQGAGPYTLALVGAGGG